MLHTKSAPYISWTHCAVSVNSRPSLCGPSGPSGSLGAVSCAATFSAYLNLTKNTEGLYMQAARIKLFSIQFTVSPDNYRLGRS